MFSLRIFERNLRAILCGGVWNGFLLGQAKKENVPCRFCGQEKMEMVTYSGSVLSSLSPPFSMYWPRCLLWHGWLPGLNGISGKDPWATSFSDLASFHLEQCLDAYPVVFASCWTPPEYWDANDIALEMSEYPNVWD